MKVHHFLFSAICILLMAISCQKEPQVVKVESVSLNSTSMTMVEGDLQSLTATVSPSNADNKKVIWSSSNSSVATVDDRGTVTAIAPGTATITAKSDDGGKTATCAVTVNSKVISVESVSLDKTSAEITEGETITLTATVKPDNATNKKVTWSSSNEEIATVKDGVVTAIKEGEATITAKTEDGGKTATCSVTVKEKVYPVESIELDKTTAEITEGETLTLTATIKPENASNKNVIWSSSNEEIATVKDGVVTAIKEGEATITAKTEDGGKTATCSVTVKEKVYPVESIELDKTTAEITEGETLTLTATIKPENASNKNVIWSSSNEEIATVKDGVVTAIKEGEATITAKTEDGGKTATCNVIVNPKTVSVTGVNLDKSSIELAEGDKMTLLATVEPENATNKNVMWSSSNDDIITVINGELTAISPGYAIVCAETEDGGFVAKCNVTVKGIKLQDTIISIMEGESAKLSYTCYPSDLELNWSSANSEIASVDNDGLVIAKKKGSTTISVCSVDGHYSAECQIVVTDVTDMVDIWCYSLDFSNGSYSNGTFTSGAKITWAIMNNTPYLINIDNINLLDGISRASVTYSLQDLIVIDSGRGITLTTTIIANMYMPIIQVTFGSYWGDYTKEYQFTGSVGGGSSKGTFSKSKNATWDVRGVNGIPEGWTVQIAE